MIMTKVPEHPRPHNFDLNFGLGMETAIDNNSTMITTLKYDEGLGVINSYKSNPQNASFAEYAGTSCYPTSRIGRVFHQLTVSLSKDALETDKIHQIRFATMKIATSFMDGQLAEDEVSTLDLNEILELQNESTDRQTYPLYNGVKCKSNKASLLTLPADIPDMTTNQQIEGIAFSEDDYYDCLHYYTNGNKMRAMTSGLRWHILTRQRPSMTLYFNQDEQTKYMNPYAGLFTLIHLPKNSAITQFGKVGDTTDQTHLEVNSRIRYNEFNHEFNHGLQ